jgi:hypothetical protein
MTELVSPALMRSPAFLLVALIAGRTTRDKALERLANRRLARLGIKVTFASGKSKAVSQKAVQRD